MAPTLPVLVGTQALDLGAALAGWIRRSGFEVEVSADGACAVRALQRSPFAASFLDAGFELRAGEPVWRVVRPILGRRLILMARQRHNELWFEALQAGVGSVLPLPAAEPMVRAALAAVSAR